MQLQNGLISLFIGCFDWTQDRYQLSWCSFKPLKAVLAFQIFSSWHSNNFWIWPRHTYFMMAKTYCYMDQTYDKFLSKHETFTAHFSLFPGTLMCRGTQFGKPCLKARKCPIIKAEKEARCAKDMISDGFTHRLNMPWPWALHFWCPNNSFLWRFIINLNFAKLRRGITSQFTLKREKM